MIYVRALALGCFYSYNYYYRHLSEGADRVAGQVRGDKEYPFSGVTKSGRVWRKVPEGDVRSVCNRIFSINLTHGTSHPVSGQGAPGKADRN